MREREADDTPKPGGPPQPESDHPAGSYYYDDATGYETFDSEADEEGRDEATDDGEE